LLDGDTSESYFSDLISLKIPVPEVVAVLPASSLKMSII
jgi:hypothetical protein